MNCELSLFVVFHSLNNVFISNYELLSMKSPTAFHRRHLFLHVYLLQNVSGLFTLVCDPFLSHMTGTICKYSMKLHKLACIGVLGIQDICHFTSRDIEYFPVYFQGYGILRSISGILLFFLQIYTHREEIRITSININSSFPLRGKRCIYTAWKVYLDRDL